MKVYINGKLVDEGDAKISALDRGFLLGEGLFETMRSYQGVIFMLDRHLDRLLNGVRTLGFEGTPRREIFAEACNSVLTANALGDARLRITLTMGPVGSPEPTIVVTAFPYIGYNKALYKKGMSVITLHGFRMSNTPIHAIKSTSYLSSIIARQKASALGCDEAILINEAGNITEGSYTNIFGVKAGTISTPQISDGLLPGVTREIAIEIAMRAGYKVLQQSIHADEIPAMDEMFLTNSLMEVMPLTEVDGYKIGDGSPGLITLDIAQSYQYLVHHHKHIG
ncbi:MAG TPA: aminotransferase class IV [Anaerolineae bacterium]|jgi:branched-subunit amino acid aminotransferase/4-amino-4-deoxychorismate lyase|nr:aminotransferase class IV [Anaerolineae bacterium]